MISEELETLPAEYFMIFIPALEEDYCVRWIKYAGLSLQFINPLERYLVVCIRAVVLTRLLDPPPSHSKLNSSRQAPSAYAPLGGRKSSNDKQRSRKLEAGYLIAGLS